MRLADLKNKEIHLVGVSGAEVSGLALFLASEGCKNLIGHDFKIKGEFKRSFYEHHEKTPPSKLNNDFQKLTGLFKKINYKASYLKGIGGADIVFTASSWFRYGPNKKLAEAVKRKKIVFWNWYNLLLEFYQGKWVGITGTAGKGTAANVLGHLLKTAGLKSRLIGDSWQGMDFISLFKYAGKEILIAEVNNRTLTFAKYSRKSPPIAVITNVFPNHLDDHHDSFEEYKSVKFEIGRYQKTGDKIILNKDDIVLRNSPFKKRAIFYSLKDKEIKLINNEYLTAGHLKSDSMAAAKVAKLLMVNEAKIRAGFKTFRPRSGRLELVRNWRGIKFVDDGAATRIQSAILAVAGYAQSKVLLILEGSRKNPEKYQEEFKKLITVLKKQKVKRVLISGGIKDYLASKINKAGLPLYIAPNLQGSVQAAAQAADKGDIVLLSPACESFGQFKDYRERSAMFKKLVLALK